eukprot:TRINITY_DN5958_c0_g1_i1.p1 TRINITY_DN5958_c0_g1~~TRINITY_DN5958_c0_g1_i1.p1  ORF type:complete len:1309 (-),score=280.11 TRINITY_DN5958_c0_g1_i1:138-4064(-)
MPKASSVHPSSESTAWNGSTSPRDSSPSSPKDDGVLSDWTSDDTTAAAVRQPSARRVLSNPSVGLAVPAVSEGRRLSFRSNASSRAPGQQSPLSPGQMSSLLPTSAASSSAPRRLSWRSNNSQAVPPGLFPAPRRLSWFSSFSGTKEAPDSQRTASKQSALPGRRASRVSNAFSFHSWTSPSSGCRLEAPENRHDDRHSVCTVQTSAPSRQSMSPEPSSPWSPGGSPVGRTTTTGTSTHKRRAVMLNVEQQREMAAAAEQVDRDRAQRWWVKKANAIVGSTWFSALTTLLTIYALIGDDFRLMLTSLAADVFFDLMTGLCLLVFSVEIVLSCIGKSDYICGFFFWLDAVSTVTLVLDITTVNDALLQGNDDDIDQMKNSRTARIGARAARVVRVLRLVRVLKLYKALYEARNRKDKDKEKDDDEWEEDDDIELEVLDESMAAESQVGKKLSDLTTRRCVIVVLTMMLVHPMLEPPKATLPDSAPYAADLVLQAFVRMEANSSEDNRWRYERLLLRHIYFHNWYSEALGGCVGGQCPAGYDNHMFWFGVGAADEHRLQHLSQLARIRPSTMAAWSRERDNDFMFQYGDLPEEVRDDLVGTWDTWCQTSGGQTRVGKSLLSRDIEGIVSQVTCPDDLRRVERTVKTATMVKASTLREFNFVFYFDKRRIVRGEARNNFFTTLFICVVLCGASMIFAHDAKQLVLNPLELMMLKVHMIRDSPLIAATLADDAWKKEEILQARATKDMKRRKGKAKDWINWILCTKPSSKKPPKPMETAILEQTIIKLGALLSLGLGAAGVNIISKNMQSEDSAGVNAMVPGSMTECILGLVRVPDFGAFTQVLQSDVNTFANQVAEIVHGVTDAYLGAPSRTNGESFLLVWKVEQAETLSRLADLSVLASLLMIAGIHSSPALAAYRDDPRLQLAMGSKCRVCITLGLHFGWAIEGAIGSEYKIDATHVSPHVSIVEEVERATEAYATCLLLSAAAKNSMSQDMAKECRIVDHVKLAGSSAPIELYTVDANYTLLEVEPEVRMKWNPRERYRARRRLEAEKVQRLQEDCFETFLEHEQIAQMNEPFTEEFREVFGMGYQNYAAGEWQSSRFFLQRTRTMLGWEDGPSASLLRYMRGHGFTAPEGWTGIHPLADMMAASKPAVELFRPLSANVHAEPICVTPRLATPSIELARFERNCSSEIESQCPTKLLPNLEKISSCNSSPEIVEIERERPAASIESLSGSCDWTVTTPSEGRPRLTVGDSTFSFGHAKSLPEAAATSRTSGFSSMTTLHVPLQLQRRSLGGSSAEEWKPFANCVPRTF